MIIARQVENAETSHLFSLQAGYVNSHSQVGFQNCHRNKFDALRGVNVKDGQIGLRFKTDNRSGVVVMVVTKRICSFSVHRPQGSNGARRTNIFAGAETGSQTDWCLIVQISAESPELRGSFRNSLPRPFDTVPARLRN